MDIQPVDLVALFGVMVGGAVVIIPILGLTLRFAVKPVIESYARLKQSTPDYAAYELELLKRRVQELEEHLELPERSEPGASSSLSRPQP